MGGAACNDVSGSRELDGRRIVAHDAAVNEVF
jgi:hypothetical protein